MTTGNHCSECDAYWQNPKGKKPDCPYCGAKPDITWVFEGDDKK